MKMYKKYTNSQNMKNTRFQCENVLLNYNCTSCDFETDLKVTLHEHVKNNHQSFQNCSETNYSLNNYTCKYCEFATHSIIVWSQHDCISDVSEEKNKYFNYTILDREEHSCSLCLFKTKFEENLETHVAEFHTTPERFQCDYCGYTTKVKFYWTEHLKDIHKVNIFCCNLCEYRSMYNYNLQYHLETRHTEIEMRFKCPDCSFKTKYSSSLILHSITEHTNPEKIKCFKCNQCTYKAQRRDTLNAHIRYKHSSKNLADRHSMRNHIASNHTKPEKLRWYECDQCSYKTVLKYCLKKHVITHNIDPEEIKYYKCDECEYSAKFKFELERHMKTIHQKANQEQHACSYCSFTTVHKNSLKKHVLRKHTDPGKVEWFNCDLCQFKTTTKSFLEKHVQIKHTILDETHFECEKCSFKTLYKRSLKRHMINRHTDPE